MEQFDSDTVNTTRWKSSGFHGAQRLSLPSPPLTVAGRAQGMWGLLPRCASGKNVAAAAGLFHCGKGSKLFCTMALEQNFLLNQVLPFYPGGGSGAILTLSQNPCTNVSSANYTLCCRRLPPSHRLAAPCPRPAAPRGCPRHRLCA